MSEIMQSVMITVLAIVIARFLIKELGIDK